MTLRIAFFSAFLAAAALADNFTPRTPTYRLHPGDSLDLHFTFTPEFDETAVLGPDGFLMLKACGTVEVGGLTVAEASKRIRALSAERLRDPEVTVTLRDFVKPHVVIAGEVVRPGQVELRGSLSLVEAIAISGGFKDSSRSTQVVVVHRTSPEIASVRVFDVKALMTAANIREDVTLSPDDLVIVPKNRLGKIEPYVRVASMGLNGLYSVALLK